MEFVKSKSISLKANPNFNEKWLQEQLANDPSLLGLGDLILRGSERRQPRAGRLDLLLSDESSSTRYEVEIQLGATDESHIIRTIEYWDLERNRYPQYDHIAVLVAEDVTSRFLNVISLFNKSIPLIVIQMRALAVNGIMTLSATTVLDLTRLGTEDEDEIAETTDRSYWLQRSSEKTLALVDQLHALVKKVDPSYELKYNKFYIGLSRNGIANNFVHFGPRKDHTIMILKIPRNQEVSDLLDSANIEVLEYQTKWGQYRLRVTSDVLTKNEELLLGLIRRAYGSYSEE